MTIRAMVRPATAMLVFALAAGCWAQPTGNEYGKTNQPKAASKPPATPKHPVTDEFFGTRVTEDYRWLEDWNNPDVKAWSDAQNAYARSILDHLPSVDAIRARVTELRSAAVPDYGSLRFQGGQLFALKVAPPKQQPMIVVMKSADDPASERVVVDPNAIDPSGSTAIDFYVPSQDGRLLAVSMSKGGSESGDVHIFEVATGKQVHEVIPRVNGGTAGGSVAWNADGSGFFYTRYPRGTERKPEDMDFFQQVYFHKLGTPTDSDKYEIGKEFPRIAEVALETSDDGQFIAATVANGDGGEFEHFIRNSQGEWKRVDTFDQRATHAHFGPPDMYCLVSLNRAPRGQILQVPLSDPNLANADKVIPQNEWVIEDFARTQEHFYVRYQAGGPSQLMQYDFRGTPEGIIPIPPVSAVEEMAKLAGDEILFKSESFISPPAWYRVGGASSTPVKTALAQHPKANFDDCEVLRETAVSKDGTKVPITIVRPKGLKLDGTAPTLLWGYGGYSVNTAPSFSEARRVWTEQGGVLAFANIRGGGEFGEEWHTGGNLLNKQNVFDDFYACMERLKELKYCTTDKLAIYGGSNGGLLMGAMITQHPDSCRAVVSAVGIYDMLRVELSPNGAFNVTEFGTVKNEDQFRAMYAYSPLHHVKPGTPYPAILFMTGANDPRVDPMQSRKMTAALQAATTSGKPVLLRTSANAGHGIGSSLSERIEQDVDRYAFLFHELGVEYKPVK